MAHNTRPNNVVDAAPDSGWQHSLESYEPGVDVRTWI